MYRDFEDLINEAEWLIGEMDIVLKRMLKETHDIKAMQEHLHSLNYSFEEYKIVCAELIKNGIGIYY